MKLIEKLALVLSYVLMVALNAAANIVPINGVGTGAISDSYPNLFAPAGYTFAIWGVIYLMLFVLILYWVTRKPSEFATTSLQTQGTSVMVQAQTVTWTLVVSSVANALWILAWHYRLIALSLVLMLVILGCLILAMRAVNGLQWPMAKLAWVKPAIGVYFGWITVATIANVTTLLVSIGWDGFGISEATWLMVMLGISAVVAVLTIRWARCGAYGLVVLWAYGGILSKHRSPEGFNGDYPAVIAVLVAVLVIVGVATVFEMYKTAKRLRG